MFKHLIPIVCLIALAGCQGQPTPPTSEPTASSSEASDAPAIVPFLTVESLSQQSNSTDVAATAFLNSLTPEQRQKAVLPLDSPLRSNWSNLPVGVLKFERNGIRIGDLTADQLTKLFELLSTALSEDGYDAIARVVAADQILSTTEKAERFQWTEKNYWIAFFGEPSAQGQWGLQFGGHHLGLNLAFEKGQASSLSPTFIGIEPSQYELDGIQADPLKANVQDGLALIQSLSAEQQQAATVQERPKEVYTGPQKDGFIPPIEGSPVSNWSPEQTELLLKLVKHWVGLRPSASATTRMQEIEVDLDKTYFAWHGPTDGSGQIYFRVQGPRLILEFSTENNLGVDVGHYHSVYRNPTLEYGMR